MKISNGALQEQYEMSQSDIGKELFLKQQTIQKIEKSAIENLKKAFAERNINIKDYLND